MTARAAVMRLLDGRQDALDAPIPLMEHQLAPSDGQRVQNAIDRIKLLFGKDFPVLPASRSDPMRAEFDASLGDQDALDRERFVAHQWLADPARLRARRSESLRLGARRSRGARVDRSKGRLHRRPVPAPRRSGVGRTARGVDPA